MNGSSSAVDHQKSPSDHPDNNNRPRSFDMMSKNSDNSNEDSMSISTLTADGHTHLAKLFRKNIRDKNFWEIVRTIKKRIDDVELVREGFIAIGDLAFESPASQKVLGEVGACSTIVYGMKMHAHHLGVAFTGLTAVTALLLNGNTDNVMKMTQAGGCKVVVDVLARHLDCAYVALGGALAVHRLAEGFVENATALGESGAGDLILKVIKMHMDKQDLVLAGLKAMNAICFHNRENSLRCIAHRAYELIIAVLNMHRADMDIVLMGCVAVVVLGHKRVDTIPTTVDQKERSGGSSSSYVSGSAAVSSLASNSSYGTVYDDAMEFTQQDAVIAVTNAVKAHRNDRSIAAAGSLAIRRIIHNYTRKGGHIDRLRDNNLDPLVSSEKSPHTPRSTSGDKDNDNAVACKESQGKEVDQQRDFTHYNTASKSVNPHQNSPVGLLTLTKKNLHLSEAKQSSSARDNDNKDSKDNKVADGSSSSSSNQLDIEGMTIGKLVKSDSFKSDGNHSNRSVNSSRSSGKSLGRLKVSSGPGAGTSYMKSERRDCDEESLHTGRSSVFEDEDEQITMALENILISIQRSPT